MPYNHGLHEPTPVPMEAVLNMPEFPSRLLFKTVVTCRRMPAAPRIDGDLSHWEGIAPLPHLGSIEGVPPAGDVWVAWSEAGLYVAARVEKSSAVVSNRRRPQNGDGLQIIVDTRAVQNVHRATRFCHLFILLPKGGGLAGDAPIAWQAEIPGARESARLCKPGDIPIAATTDTARGFYTLEAALPAAVLTGWEPAPGVRLGFQYWLHDVQRGSETWSTSPDFPAMQDPSLWGLLELGE
jgi:hypothetical protein